MQRGDFVRVAYTGRIKGTNELFDTTDEALARKEGTFNAKAKYGPVPIVVGESRLIKGLDAELLKMSVREKKSVEVQPEMAFGLRNARMIKTLPITQFRSQNVEPVPGLVITMNNLMGKVLSASSGRVKVDFNHPLAGKALLYDLHIVEIIDKPDVKVAAIVEFYTGKKEDISISGEEAVIGLDATKEVKEAVSRDVMKFVPEIKRVKFEEIFEAEATK